MAFRVDVSFFLFYKDNMKKIKEICGLCKRTFIVNEDDRQVCGDFICEECLNFLLDEAEVSLD
jgi:ribosomal protein S27AE